MDDRQGLLARLSTWANGLKREIAALWFALRDPVTPWYAKALGFLVVGYAISPIDLIPDFIPVLGYLDDIVLLPLGLALLRRLIPTEVMTRSRERATEAGQLRITSRAAAVVVVFLWLGAALLIVLFVIGRFAGH
ncbi:MAG TPA: YkvA family protein [Rectinemataceae bacterium]|nr:YkvA family protein [Rectinemataceae bacterium]